MKSSLIYHTRLYILNIVYIIIDTPIPLKISSRTVIFYAAVQ